MVVAEISQVSGFRAFPQIVHMNVNNAKLENELAKMSKTKTHQRLVGSPFTEVECKQ